MIGQPCITCRRRVWPWSRSGWFNDPKIGRVVWHAPQCLPPWVKAWR